MKFRLLAVVLPFSFSVTAVRAAHASVDHRHPVFVQANTTYILEDWKDVDDGHGNKIPAKDGALVVEWVAAEQQSLASPPRGANTDRPDTVAYRVTITRSSTDAAYYSLLTLGIQSPRHKVNLKVADGAVKIVADPTVDPTPAAIPATGVTLEKVPPKSVPTPPKINTTLNEDKIGFLYLDKDVTRCTLEIEAEDRYVYAVTRWAANKGGFRQGHDTEPPENPPR